jgi:K+-sensing histidine kinase KdpD
MSEATRLEHAIENSQKESLNLTEVITGCMHGYALAYPDQHFKITLTQDKFVLLGVPEFIAQLLDKLINNAADFAQTDSQIEVNFELLKGNAQFRIYNQGPQLPEHMATHIFDSMVSVRDTSKQSEPHLGLGLYMARLICDFHNADIHAINKENGVEFRVTFKLDC